MDRRWFRTTGANLCAKIRILLVLCTTLVFTSAHAVEVSGSNAVTQENSLEITLGDAIIMALQNNRALSVESLNPAIRETYEQQESAVFDPSFSAELSASRERKSETAGISEGDTGAGMSIGKFLPTGTALSAEFTAERDWSDLYSDRYKSRLGFTVTRALLQGAGLDFNLANIRQAKLDTISSQHQLRGFTENLVAEVETTYWNYALAVKQLEIYRQSMELAQKQLKEIEERISVGTLAEIELAAAQAEAALRREALINAHSNMETKRLQLLRLLNPSEGKSWTQKIILKNLPAVPDVKLDNVENHSALALEMRPDIRQARLSIERGEIEIVKTKNGLLPRMDLFISLGKTGYASSFGSSAGDIFGKNYDISAGLAFEWPLGNRDAEARHKRALLSQQQAEEALENLSQLADMDVRFAYIQVNRASQQIEATAATLHLQEEKMRSETEKFRVGRSTSLLVAQTQRDLLAARISEVEAVVNYLNSLVDLFRLESSLLERRGISTGSGKL